MAALIHNCTVKSSPNHPPKSPATSYLLQTKSPISIAILKPQFSSSTIPNSPSFHPLLTPIQQIQPISNHELSNLLRLSDIRHSKAIHASILKSQEQTHLFNSLITSYLRLGHIEYAEKIFESILNPDIVSYTAMVSGLAKLGKIEAVRYFFEMRELGIEPNEYSFVALLTSCVRLFDLKLGFQVHAFTVKTGCIDCVYVANALMALYGKCGYLELMVKVFDEMPQRDIASWNTVISCLVREGLYDRVFELFRDTLRLDGCRVDYFTLSSLLVACGSCFHKMGGKEVHAYAYKIGYESNLSVNNALVEFYSKCGSLKDVENLFDGMPVRDLLTFNEMINAYMGFGFLDSALDVFYCMPEKNCVSYNALLSGFCQNGEGFRAFKLFCRMVEGGMEISDFTLTSLLNACGLMKDRRISEQIHGFVLKFDLGSNDCIETALLDMCTRCGRMADARKMLNRLPFDQNRSIMLTSMICGYSRNSELEKAVSLISQLHFHLDEVALASILGVCGDLGFQNLGEQFQCKALKYGFNSDTGVGNATISMYSKCGCITPAVKVFEQMPKRDIISWNSLLSGYILNRQGESALNLWGEMENARIQPDKVTCSLVISAYRHTDSNSVEDCLNFFHSMKSVHRVEPDSDHYACLVRVLGIWGFLENAEELIENMPIEPKASVWRALLDSSRIHANSTIGKRAAKEILSIEPNDPSIYILKSNLYSASGRWHCADNVRGEMREKGFRKFPGRAWIVHENKVHSFFARDRSHSQSKDIYSGLDILFMECLKAGYVPDTSFVLHEVEEYQKRDFLLYHSGKLAVTYGLLTTRPGKIVRVVKNIHLCGDCHTFFKYISIVTKREVHVRDSSGFHRFAYGECSCRDYW